MDNGCGRGPNMQMRSGKPFFPLDPKVEEVCILDIAWSLAHQCRFNGHCNGHYSVAQHSVLVSEIVGEEFAFEGLMHDAAEAYVGDMVKPLKMVIPEFEVIEARIWVVVAEKFGLPLELSNEVKHADIVAAATEIRDIMAPGRGVSYGMDINDIARTDRWLICEPPGVAYKSFLGRYSELR